MKEWAGGPHPPTTMGISLPPEIEQWLVAEGCSPEALVLITSAPSVRESSQDMFRAMGYTRDWRRHHPASEPPTLLFLALAGNGYLSQQVEKIVETFKPETLPVAQAEREIEDLLAGLHPLWVAKQIDYIERRQLSRRMAPIKDVWAYVLTAFDDRVSHDKWVASQ